jgi:hypothetical protein
MCTSSIQDDDVATLADLQTKMVSLMGEGAQDELDFVNAVKQERISDIGWQHGVMKIKEELDNDIDADVDHFAEVTQHHCGVGCNIAICARLSLFVSVLPRNLPPRRPHTQCL